MMVHLIEQFQAPQPATKDDGVRCQLTNAGAANDGRDHHLRARAHDRAEPERRARDHANTTGALPGTNNNPHTQSRPDDAPPVLGPLRRPRRADGGADPGADAVSYTHLTLPTKA